MKIIISFILLISIVITLSSCTAHNQPIQKQPIKIGVIGTLTGVGAYQGQQEIRGLELAKQTIQQKYNQEIKLIVEDSQASPEKAVQAVKKIIEVDQTKFIIGDSWSSTTLPMSEITNKNNILLFSPLALLDNLSKDDLFFRNIPTTAGMMKKLAIYIYNNLNSQRVGILSQQTDFGAEHTNDFKLEFKKLGGEIVGEEYFDLQQTDLKTEILKIKEKKPDTILNLHATGGGMIGLLIKQAKELGLNVNWISSFGAQNAPLIEQFSQTVEGLIYPYPYDENPEIPNIQEFVRLYQNKYNELPDLTAANSYDALMLLVQAINQVGENPHQVKEYLLNIKDYPGASGTLSFDKNGDVEKPIIIKQIKNGEFIKID